MASIPTRVVPLYKNHARRNPTEWLARGRSDRHNSCGYTKRVDFLSWFGLVAVSTMLLAYALEDRGGGTLEPTSIDDAGVRFLESLSERQLLHSVRDAERWWRAVSREAART